MTSIICWAFRIAPRQSWIYALLWLLWLLVLWKLSSAAPPATDLDGIPHIDKVLHLGYFGCGSILFTSFMFHLRAEIRSAPMVFIASFIGALVGAIDEYHQSKVEGRFGNDLGDWLADCSGSIIGALLVLWGWRKWGPGCASKIPEAEEIQR